MSWEAWFTVGVVLLDILLLMFTRLTPDIVMVSGMTMILLAGVLTPEDALARLGVSFMPFVMVGMVAASFGFAPIGYQTNLMVYGPGGYKFADYLRVGVPLDLLMGLVAVLIAPLVWSFGR